MSDDIADDDSHQRSGSMSVIRYAPSEIVLRHNDAVVLYDPSSRQLVLRNQTESQDLELANCPYCRRPLQPESREQSRPRQSQNAEVHGGFVNPEYFRLLHRNAATPTSASSHPPSPRRRLAQPVAEDGGFDVHATEDAEFVGISSAASQQGIASTSLSEGYFNRFFAVERELGRGGKGVVLLVKHVLDGVNLGHFACKRVPVGDNHEWLEKVLIEVQLLQHLSHKNLVAYHHVWLENYKVNNFGPSVPCAFILQKYCNGGDLHHYVCGSPPDITPVNIQKEKLRRRSKGRLEPVQTMNRGRVLVIEQIYSFFKDITSGLNYLHKNGYIHRDLKPQNCLLHDTGTELRVLVSDFGEVQVQNMARQSTGTTGTISYCAPEVLRRDAEDGTFGNFTTKSDIFSLGMILYFLCFRELPYINADILEENEDLDLLREEISLWPGFADDDHHQRSDLPDKLYSFLKRLLALDPVKRPTAEDVLAALRTGAGLGDLSGRITSISTTPARNRKPPGSSSSGMSSQAPGPVSRRARSSMRNGTGSGSSGHAIASIRTSSTSEPYDEDQNYMSDSSLILRPPRLASPSHSPERPQLMPPPDPVTLAMPFRYIILHQSLVISLRLGLFLFKVISFTQPCNPKAVNPRVLYPVLFLAVIDFGHGFIGSLGVLVSTTLLLVHIFLIWLTMRMDVLCVPDVRPWESF